MNINYFYLTISIAAVNVINLAAKYAYLYILSRRDRKEVAGVQDNIVSRAYGGVYIVRLCTGIDRTEYKDYYVYCEDHKDLGVKCVEDRVYFTDTNLIKHAYWTNDCQMFDINYNVIDF